MVKICEQNITSANITLLNLRAFQAYKNTYIARRVISELVARVEYFQTCHSGCISYN